MNGKIKVILVEDDLDLRESLVECLALAGLDACGVGSVMEFFRATATTSFSIAVVDLGLPDHCGYQLTEQIRKETEMGVIILTARDGVEDRVRGYDSGADLYMVKPVDCRELASAITNLTLRLGRGGKTPPKEAQPASWHLVKQHWHLVTPSGSAILLTAKEMQFMECLAEFPGGTVPREAVLAVLGYRDDEYASRALDSLVRRLRRKIEEEPGLPAPIKTVHGQGYRFSARVVIA